MLIVLNKEKPHLTALGIQMGCNGEVKHLHAWLHFKGK